MAATWIIESLDYKIENGSPTYITNIHWRCEDRNGEIVGDAYGSEPVPEGHGSNQVPYENLNENQVVGWLHGLLGGQTVSEIETGVTARLAEKENPSKGNGRPW